MTTLHLLVDALFFSSALWLTMTMWQFMNEWVTLNVTVNLIWYWCKRSICVCWL